MTWPALAAARAHDAAARVPFVIDGVGVGSVARAHLSALRVWPEFLRVNEAGITLTAAAEVRDTLLARINAALRAQGLIRAWRDERFAIVNPASGQPLAHTERAAARFWGTLTFGAHANGYVADPQGRPSHLWIAQRALHKATDPGLFDNLVGGGVAAGQTPFEALLREGFEEAGLPREVMATAQPGRVLRLQRDIAEGHQLEDLHADDLTLPAGLQPQNHDGEVAGFQLLPVAQAHALAAGSTMAVDAALVTLDFPLRHRLLSPTLSPADNAALAPALFACAVRRHQKA